MFYSQKTGLSSYFNTYLVPVALILWYMDFSSIKRGQNVRTCPVPLSGLAQGSNVMGPHSWEVLFVNLS